MIVFLFKFYEQNNNLQVIVGMARIILYILALYSNDKRLLPTSSGERKILNLGNECNLFIHIGYGVIVTML